MVTKLKSKRYYVQRKVFRYNGWKWRGWHLPVSILHLWGTNPRTRLWRPPTIPSRPMLSFSRFPLRNLFHWWEWLNRHPCLGPIWLCSGDANLDQATATWCQFWKREQDCGDDVAESWWGSEGEVQVRTLASLLGLILREEGVCDT